MGLSKGPKLILVFRDYCYLFIYYYIYGVVLQLSSCITMVTILQGTGGRGLRHMRRDLGLLMGTPATRMSDQ